MVPGLALWLPSGYSYGAVLLVLSALASAAMWWWRPVPRAGWWLAACFSAMAAVWLLDVPSAQGWGSLDKPLKYLLALPCLFFVLAFPPRTCFLWTGLVVGAIGSGLIAVYQAQVLGMPRANGFTNAIQYGDLSLLLGVACGVLLLVQWSHWSGWQRLACAGGAVLGVVGSLLSQSRGGWLALLILLPVCLWSLAHRGRHKAVATAGLLASLMAMALVQLPAIEHRLDAAFQEVQAYQSSGDGATSVGHRLAHWQLAWAMGLNRPWTGWGRAGYEAEKGRRVAAGQAHPMVLQFGHAHNEALDLFAKRGIPGVLVLMLFYAVPLVLFWPSPARITDQAGQLDSDSLCLCLVGVLLPVSYIGFGLTQTFLAHNSGNIFYLFMCLLTLGSLQGRRSRMCRAAL